MTDTDLTTHDREHIRHLLANVATGLDEVFESLKDRNVPRSDVIELLEIVCDRMRKLLADLDSGSSRR